MEVRIFCNRLVWYLLRFLPNAIFRDRSAGSLFHFDFLGADSKQKHELRFWMFLTGDDGFRISFSARESLFLSP